MQLRNETSVVNAADYSPKNLGKEKPRHLPGLSEFELTKQLPHQDHHLGIQERASLKLIDVKASCDIDASVGLAVPSHHIVASVELAIANRCNLLTKRVEHLQRQV